MSTKNRAQGGLCNLERGTGLLGSVGRGRLGFVGGEGENEGLASHCVCVCVWGGGGGGGGVHIIVLTLEIGVFKSMTLMSVEVDIGGSLCRGCSRPC